MSKWQKVKLDECIEQIRGVSYKPEDATDAPTEGFYPILRANNIKDNSLFFDDFVYVREKKIKKEQMIQKGDIIVCASSGSKDLVGKAAQANENLNMSFGAFCKCVRPKNILPTYLGAYFKSPIYRKTVSLLSAGANINNIKNEHIANLLIPLPPMEEQKKIAARLDAVSDLLTKQKQLLSEQDNLIQSTFYDMFGNPIKNEKGWKFSKISSIYKVRSSQRIYQKDLALSGIPFLRVSDLEKKINCVSPNINLFISDEFFSILHKNGDIPEENDILITTRGTLGDVYIYKNNDRFYFQDGMITWLKQNKNSIMPLFFLYLFKTCEFKNSLHKYKGGTTVAYLSIKNLSDLLIPVPPLELQQKFAAVAEQIESEKSKIKSAIAETQTLFNALMAEYFEE